MATRPFLVALAATSIAPFHANAQCDGRGTWRPGVGTTSGISGSIFALAADKDRLYAGGTFANIGGSPANRIGAYDGSSWHALGAGLGEREVGALTLFRGELIAAGRFDRVGDQQFRLLARWDGESWNPLNDGATDPNAWVYALAVYNNDLIIGGSFSEIDHVPAVNTARWDGTHWHAFPSGSTASLSGHVNTFIEYNGDLIAGGTFTIVNSDPPGRAIARWNGVGWEPLHPISPLGIVFAMAVYRGELIIAGVFGINPAPRHSVLRWDGSEWISLGPAGAGVQQVYSLSVVGDDLIAAGLFNSIGGIAASNIARWNGAEWRPIGPGANHHIDRTFTYNDELLVCGAFTRINAQEIYGFARWLPPTPLCPADYDCSGSLDSSDFSGFLSDFLGGNPPDFNHDDRRNSQDFFDFLAAFFAGC